MNISGKKLLLFWLLEFTGNYRLNMANSIEHAATGEDLRSGLFLEGLEDIDDPFWREKYFIKMIDGWKRFWV